MCNRKKGIIIIIGVILAETFFICILCYNMRKQILRNQAEYDSKFNVNHDIEKNITCFPIALEYTEDIYFEDSFGAYRENGRHDGCDIMYEKNVPGVVPIVSATDGTITNLGWLYLGGYRVGITSEEGIYYYYAHFDSCVPSLYVGKKIKAGELLGFMGNTGEGEEGTKGKFPVHLHFGIYIMDNEGSEESVNPYPFLLKINKE